MLPYFLVKVLWVPKRKSVGVAIAWWHFRVGVGEWFCGRVVVVGPRAPDGKTAGSWGVQKRKVSKWVTPPSWVERKVLRCVNNSGGLILLSQKSKRRPRQLLVSSKSKTKHPFLLWSVLLLFPQDCLPRCLCFLP